MKMNTFLAALLLREVREGSGIFRSHKQLTRRSQRLCRQNRNSRRKESQCTALKKKRDTKNNKVRGKTRYSLEQTNVQMQKSKMCLDEKITMTLIE